MVNRRKKTLKKRLDAFSKKRSHTAKRPAKAAAVWGELWDCHYRLMAVVNLLESCGEPLEGWQVSSAGTLAGEQVRRMEKLMNQLTTTR
jgi:hypothetical protein